MFDRIRITSAVAAVAFVWGSVPATGAVLFETLPVANTYQSPHFVSHDEAAGQGFVIPGTATPLIDLNWAFRWTASFSGTVTGIDAALSLGNQFTPVPDNSAQMFLHQDGAGLPGGVIDSYVFNNLTSETLGGAIESGASASNPAVTAGTAYWISLSAGVPANSLYSQVGWHGNDQGATGSYAAQYNNGAWLLQGSNSNLAAFRVLGAPIPLPAAGWMFLTALGGLGLFGWRRRRGAAA